MKEAKKQVGIWIRVSTDMQVKDESPEHHEQMARYYIKAKDWEVVEIYNLDAFSGKTVINHPEAIRMLNDLKSGRITGLVFSKLARLARSTKELLEFGEIFRKAGADLVSLAEQIDTSSPAGRLFFTMLAAIAEWEREEIASRVAASVPIRARLGKPLGGQASFGYKWQDKSVMIDEKEAPIRKLIYEIFLKCQRKKTTADQLNQLGYRTRKGSKFSDTTIDRLLRDTTAKGVRIANYTKSLGDGKQWLLKPEEDWVYLACPSIIDEPLWAKCNAILDAQASGRKKRVGRRSEYLLAGFINCTCGSPMYVRSTAKHFICQKCKNSIRVSDMDEVYQKVLKGYLHDLQPQMYKDEIQKDLSEKEQLLDISLKKRAHLRKKMDDLIPLLTGGLVDKVHFAELYQPLVAQVEQLDSSTPQLQSQIELKRKELNSSDFVINEAKLLYNQWTRLVFEQKRAIVETITDYIKIGEDTIDVGLYPLQSSSSSVTSPHNFMDS